MFLFAIELAGSEDGIELFECRFGPDDKSSNVSSRSEGEEIQSVNMTEFNTRNVSEGLNDLGSSLGAFLFFVVNNKRALLLDISSSSSFSFTRSKVAGFFDSFNISKSSNSFQEFDSILCLSNGSNFSISNDKGNFGICSTL